MEPYRAMTRSLPSLPLRSLRWPSSEKSLGLPPAHELDRLA